MHGRGAGTAPRKGNICMNKKRIISLIVCLGLFSALVPESRAAVTVNMAVDESQITRTIERELYGINCEWDSGMDYNFLTMEDGELKTSPTFTEAWQDTFVFGRMAGGSSQKFFWKEAIGPLADRDNQMIWHTNDKVYLGIIEWLNAVYSVTPDAKITYVVNFDTDTIENLADVVEFLVGDGTVNYNGGENWAEVRKSLGIENPVDIFTWELGNELDWTLAWDVDDYVAYCKQVIPIIKSIDPDGKIACNVDTAAHANGDGWEEWHRKVLRELGDEIDYLTFHYYYPANYVARADVPLDRVEQDILDITGSDRIKIYMSEHAPAPNVHEYNKESAYDYCLPHTIWGATAHAEFFLRAFLRPSLVASNCHSVDSSTWTIAYRDEDGIHRLSAVGETIKTFVNYGVGDVLQSDLDTFNRGENANIAGGVIRDADGNVNILFTNRYDTDPVTVNFTFDDGTYRLKKVRKIHGDVRSADNWYREGAQWEYDNPDRVYTTEEELEGESAFTSYTFDPLSIYALQLEKISDEPSGQTAGTAQDYIGIGADMPNAYVNGNTVSVAAEYEGAGAVLDNDNMLISSQMLQKLFGAVLSWDEAGTVCTVALHGRTLAFDLANGTVTENGSPADIAAGKRIGETVYFPLRAIAEGLGYNVAWDARGFAILGSSGIGAASTDIADAIYSSLAGGA